MKEPNRSVILSISISLRKRLIKNFKVSLASKIVLASTTESEKEHGFENGQRETQMLNKETVPSIYCT